jgi:hypothetical protein
MAPMTSPIAVFKEGAPTRPPIRHDHGFLDDGKGNYDPTKRQPPTAEDMKLKSNALIAFVLAAKAKPELYDGLLAFRHFLNGKGASFTCDYEKFLREDTNGQVVLTSAIEDARAGVLDIFDSKNAKPPTADRTDSFSATSDAVGVGPNIRYPTPATDNWQKAIGRHSLWLSATAKVQSRLAARRRDVEIVLTLHAEDMYNFNPGESDIQTGTPDEMNGRLEIVGLAQEFVTTGAAVRTITFTVPLERQADNRVLPKDQVVR